MSSTSDQYRFSGYQLPLLEWDETGPAWIKLPPHPYFRNQPILWQDAWSFGTPAYSFMGDALEAAQITYDFVPDDLQECTRKEDISEKNTLIRMLPF